MLDDTVADIYERASTDEHVATVHGYGIKIHIRSGHLVIQDGIGKHRRERRYPKADRTLQRIVITGPDGYVSLESLLWCSEHDIAITTLNPDGELVSAWSADTATRDAKLLRRQATAEVNGTDVIVARELLTRKVRGQADNLVKLFADYNLAGSLTRYADRMQDTDTVSGLGEIEGWAGRDYFAAWTGRVAVSWSRPEDLTRVPANWITYNTRTSAVGGKGKRKQFASDPVNAMLNYAYTIGYAECRTACVAYGLNPSLGFVHTDKSRRDSLALDLLEMIRPDIDIYVLGLLGIGSEPRKFTYRDFAEPYGYPPGTCRLVAPLTHEIAEQAWSWRKPALDAAQTVLNILTGAQGKRGTAMPHWQLKRDAFVSVSVTPGQVIPDDVWATVFAPIVPVKPRGKGHPPIDSRTLIAGMVWCDRHRKPWAHVPESLGASYRTMRERRREWQRLGVWPEIRDAIDDLASQRGM